MGTTTAPAVQDNKFRKPPRMSNFYERRGREKRDQAVNLRTTKSLKESLARLSKAWEFLDSLEENAEPFDPSTEGNVSDAALRLITQSIGPAWKEIGAFEPKTDEQFEEFCKAARAAHEKAKGGKQK
jgi:hypothetical protein